MKSLLAKSLLASATIALSLVSAAPANAISRYQTMSMSCDAVREALREDGAAILRWTSKRNPGLPLYGRYVADGRFCEMGEVAERISVPTRDDATCPVRRCVKVDVDDRRWWRRD